MKLKFCNILFFEKNEGITVTYYAWSGCSCRFVLFISHANSMPRGQDEKKKCMIWNVEAGKSQWLNWSSFFFHTNI